MTRRPDPVAPPDRVPALALLALAVLAAALAGCRIEPAGNAELREARTDTDLRAEVEALLEASAAGWNAGDLEAFLSIYARTPETTYVGGSGVAVGYPAIRRRFAPLFAPGAERDSLRFEELRVRPLGSDVALALARYVLHEGERVTGAGPFTLVLQRVGEEWRVVHDHSGSDPEYVGEASGDG